MFDAALTHGTYQNEQWPHGVATDNYERLEFLGDCVLKLVLAEKLFKETSRSEGEMTIIVSNLSENFQLPRILSKYPEIISSVRMGGQPLVDSVKADIFEALIGATYLCRWYETAKKVALTMFGLEIKNLAPETDYKSKLQICVQEKYRPPRIKDILTYDQLQTPDSDGL